MAELEPRLIAESDALASLAGAAAVLPAVHVDTEFVRTRTYYARPGLVQLEAGGDVFLVDPVALPDVVALRPLLHRPETVKVLHSGAEDLALLERMTGAIPSPIFDTQIAAAFCGLGASLGYHALVRELLGVEIDKGETRSDWTRRPLSPAQLRYAAADVAHLPALHAELGDRLERRGMTGWAGEEFAALSDPQRFAPIPSDAYRRAKRAGPLSPRCLEVFRQLWQWRELRAMELDRPRAHVVPDEILIGVSERHPTSRQGLAEVDGIGAGFVRRHAEEILGIVERARGVTPAGLPLPLSPPRESRSLVDRLRTAVKGRALALDIPPELLAGRRQLEALVIAAGSGAEPRLDGWRGEVLGREFLSLLELAAR